MNYRAVEPNCKSPSFVLHPKSPFLAPEDVAELSSQPAVQALPFVLKVLKRQE